MGFILEKIEEAIKELLIGWIESNMTNMFTDVNDKVGTIAAEVGKTPSSWDSSIYQMIRGLSENVIVPIAGIIITFVLCYELISMITEKNNLHDMLQKGFNLILVNSLREAKHRLLEDKEIELILCDLSLPDGTALELFHDIRRISEKFKVNNPPIKLLPFFILTASTDLATEYQYRHEGVSDYITAPVNIPELIRRILFFVE